MLFKISWIRLFSILYILLLVLYAISFLGLWLNFVWPNNFYSTICKNPYFFLDYTRYYMFAKIINIGQGHNIFSPDLQKTVFQSLIYPARPYEYYTDYPPFVGIVFLPLLLLNFNYGYIFFTVFSLLFFFWSLLKFRQKFNGLAHGNIVVFCLGVFACLPTMYDILLGQINFLIVTSLSLFLIAVVFSKQVVYALTTLLIICKPHYYCLFYLLSLVKAKYKLFLASLLIILGLIFLSVWFCGTKATLNYPKILYDIHAKFQYQGIPIPVFTTHTKYIISLRCLFNVFFAKGIANLVSIVIYGLGIMSALAVFYQTKWKDSQNLNWSIASVVLIFLVTSPHCFAQDLIILALPAILTLKSLDLGKILKYDVSYKIWCLIFYFYPVWSWLNYLCIGGQYDYRQYVNLMVNLCLLAIALNKYWQTGFLPQASNN